MPWLNVLYSMGSLHEIDGSAQIMLGYVLNCDAVRCSSVTVFVHPFPVNNQYYKRLKRDRLTVFSLTHNYLYYVLRIWRVLANASNRVIGKPTRKSWDDVLEQFLSFYIKWNKIDVVHVLRSDQAMPIAIRAARRASVPVIYHEMGLPRFAGDPDPYYQELPRMLPLCTSVAALSDTLSKMMAACVPPEIRSYTIPLICDDAVRPRTSMKESGSEIVIGFVGRFEALKGAVDLVEAFAKAMPRFENPARLLLAGAGPEHDRIISSARELGCGDRVSIRSPYQGEEEKAEFYNGIDILALPSYSEGTPNCIVEAFLFGRPAIAYSAGGVPDLVNSERGALIEAGDVNGLAEAIATLVNDRTRRERAGETAREFAKAAFSKERVLPILRQVYEETIAAHG